MCQEVITNILDTASYAEAHLARADDKDFIFSECQKCFVMYQEKMGYFVSLGDPAGPVELWQETISRFIAHSKVSGKKPIFYKAERCVPIIQRKRFVIEKIGEDGVLDLAEFSMAGKSKAGLRRKINQSRKAGVSCRILTPKEYRETYPVLESISNRWLNEKNRIERGFSVGPMSQDYLSKQVIGVAVYESEIIAFCSVNTTKNNFEAAIDLMRHSAQPPTGTMHSLISTMIEHATERKFKQFNLCMAPLSGLENQRHTILNRAMRKVYTDFNHKHGLQGLRRFKEYFKPSWKPKYIATPRKITAYIGALRVYATVRDCK